MDAIARGLLMYFFLLILFRIAGRRTLGQLTNFDLVLLLIISEATQNAMIGNDFSVTNGILVILTLVGIDIGLSIIKQHFPKNGTALGRATPRIGRPRSAPQRFDAQSARGRTGYFIFCTRKAWTRTNGANQICRPGTPWPDFDHSKDRLI